MINNTILYKYLSGLTTNDEERVLLAWLNDSADNQKEFFELKAIWIAQRMVAEGAKEEDIQTSLKGLNDRMDAIQGLASVKTQRRLPNSLYRNIAAAAAIALLIVSGLYFLMDGTLDSPVMDNELATVYTNREGAHVVQTMLLPDSTVVWLSNNTTLTCPYQFTGDQRVVSLSGEAFFEVKKDPNHPFIVKTDAYEVKVLGTSFSVNTHASVGRGETVLMNGSVEIQEPDGRSLAMLRPGQQALYSKDSKKIEIRAVDANALTSWRFGLVSLTETSISDIIRCLEDTYNVKIKMNSSQIKDHCYNFSFKRSKGAQPALDQLYFITGISAEILP